MRRIALWAVIVTVILMAIVLNEESFLGSCADRTSYGNPACSPNVLFVGLAFYVALLLAFAFDAVLLAIALVSFGHRLWRKKP